MFSKKSTLIIFLIMLIVFIYLIEKIASNTILKDFLKIEDSLVVNNFEKIKRSFQRELEFLDSRVKNYVNNDEIYTNSLKKDRKYFTKKFPTETFIDTRIDLMAIRDIEGKIIFVKMVDKITKNEIDVTNEMHEALQSVDIKKDSSKGEVGFLYANGSIHIFVWKPILKSDFSGRIAGYFMAGRIFDEERKRNISRDLSIPISLNLLNQNNKFTEISQEKTDDFVKANENLKKISEDSIGIYKLYYDVNDKPIMMLSYLTDRAIYKSAKGNNLYFVIVISSVSFLLLSGIFILVIRLINSKKVIENSQNLLKTANDELEEKINKRTSELHKANLQLQFEINERIEIEKTLRESEERFRQLAENIKDGIIIVEKRKISYLNDRACEIFGYPKEEMMKKSMMDVVAPEEKEHLKKALEEIKLSRVSPESLDYWILKPNGERRYIQSKHSSKRDGESFIEYISVTDITDRLYSTMRIEHLNSVLKSIRDVNEIIKEEKNVVKLIERICFSLILNRGYYDSFILLYDENQKFKLSANAKQGDTHATICRSHEINIDPKCHKLLNSSKKILAISHYDFCDYCIFETPEHVGKKFVISLTYQNIDFGIICVSIPERFINDDEEQFLFKELADDISFALYSSEQETKRVVLENQLLQSQKMDAIGRLAGGVAHDFNNVLTAIIGYSEILQKKLDDKPRIIKGLEQINDAARKAAELTTQLLVFSRKQLIQPKEINLNFIITDMLKMLNRLIGEDINMRVDLETNLPIIKADPGQITQVIMNLVVNARDAMPEGGKIVIKTENFQFEKEDIQRSTEKTEGHYVCLTVSDNGFGMNQETQEKIFEPFFTTKESGKGTGLGLSVVYGIVKQNHGWIEVNSELNIGSSFKVILPVYLPVESSDSDKIDIKDDYSGNGENILLIEDDEFISEFAREILTEKNYIVHTAFNAEEAKQIYSEKKSVLDLIFSDVVLPDGNGVEIVEEIKKDNPEIKVLFSSGYADDKSRWTIIQSKEYHFLQKPYNVFELLKIIKEILS